MGGGAQVVIQGAMMATMPNQNSIIMTETANMNDLAIAGTPLTENDEFNSNSIAGVIGY